MRYVFTFPDIGEGIEEGKILEWFVVPGQSVKSGESLVKVETDKVVADIPSPKNGQIAATFGRVGEIIHVGNPLVEIEMEGVTGPQAQETLQEVRPLKTQEPVEEKGFGVVGTLEVAGDRAVLSASDEGVAPVAKPEAPTRKVLATPVARSMAKELGLDINQVQGSGPGGRITKIDIEKQRVAPPSLSSQTPSVPAHQVPKEAVTFEPLSRIRKTIAQRMSASTQNAAHMTLFWEADVEALVALRNRHKERLAKEGVHLSYLPFVIKAIIAGLKAFPHFNSVLDLENERIILKNHYNIGLAVDSPVGLTVPVIRDADRQSISDLARSIQTLAQKARERTLSLEDLRDGTFTLTNFGALGGSFGVPVLNYPEVAILGTGRIQEKPIVKQGQIVVGQIMPLSLSVDHRLIDGGDATRFIQTVAERLEDPGMMLMD